MYTLDLHKPGLLWRNQFWQDRTKSSGENTSENLMGKGGKAYWSEVWECGWVVFFFWEPGQFVGFRNGDCNEKI